MFFLIILPFYTQITEYICQSVETVFEKIEIE